ncbi:MAG: thiol-disulfide oxidoreductase DCC family protein [Acidimicrobiales bacterium]
MSDDLSTSETGRVPLFIFDGQCGFCCRWAIWLRGRGLEHVRFEPFQSLDEIDRHGITAQDMESASFYVDEAGGVHRGSDGFIEALSDASQPWQVLARVASVRLLRIPLRRVYGVIARRRYQLPAPKANTLDLVRCVGTSD